MKSFHHRVRLLLLLFVSTLTLRVSAQDSITSPPSVPPLLSHPLEAAAFNESNLEIDIPEFAMGGVETEIPVKYTGESETFRNNSFNFFVNGKETLVEFEKGEAIIVHEFTESHFVVETGNFSVVREVPVVPLWLSIIPPLLAILMALMFREVITALFSGIFVGAAVIHVALIGIWGVPMGILTVLDTYILDAVADEDHVSVILFSMLIGAIVAVISRNGGMRGVVNRVAKFARDARSGQLATWFLGIAIFFDDYANTLVVGNTMRPVTDRLRISREKLSYLVDSTAAPISAIAFITTWIGAELGYIEGGLQAITETHGAIPGDPSPYGVFISSLQYSFYPILTLAFMLILIWRRRDYGPMYHAEVRARTTGQVSKPAQGEALEREKSQELDDLEPVRGARPNPWNAIIPIAVVIFGTMIGLWATGMAGLEEGWADDPAAKTSYEGLGFFGKLSLIIGASNSYAALLWSSLSGLMVAVLLTIGQRIMSLEST
ncbi:MAG: Na+/H+ antiporter NhaC family protein, partial [Bacteroidota bacterium]